MMVCKQLPVVRLGFFKPDGGLMARLIPGRRVARDLTAMIERRAKPAMIVSDNRTELTSNTILKRRAQP
jgi:hypothetical protein